MKAPRGKAARQRIIDATRALIYEEGLDSFNVEAVASASGSARSTIYRHWPEPHELLIDTLKSMSQELPAPDTGSLAEDLEQIAASLRPLFDDPRTQRLILDITRAATTNRDLGRVHQDLIEERHQPMRLMLQRAIARGEIDPDLDLTIALHLVEGPLMSATVLQNKPMTDNEIKTLVARIIQSLS